MNRRTRQIPARLPDGTGRVTQAALASLSERFGERVTAGVSEAVPAGGEAAPSTAVVTVEAPPVAGVEPSPAAEPQAPREGAPSLWVSPSRLPLRRPVPT
jgi:hypothetical protein